MSSTVIRDGGYKRGENGVCESTTITLEQVFVFVVLLLGFLTVVIACICVWKRRKQKSNPSEGKISRQAVVYTC